MVELPNIDWHRIRPFGNPPTRASGFEELSSILIRRGAVDWPDGVTFQRFGNPDGGREGRGVLPNGDVWAWQAKYVDAFDAATAGHVTESFRRALLVEPRLTRYFVTMPLDLPAGDGPGRSSAATRWSNKAKSLAALARAHGREVEFALVGSHELLTALTTDSNAGRARYWFDSEILTPSWLARRLEETVAKAGRRYTPRLHVEVEAVRALDGVGRSAAFIARWQSVLARLRESRQWSWRAPEGMQDLFASTLEASNQAMDAADSVLEGLIARARSSRDLPLPNSELNRAASALGELDDALNAHALSKDRYFVGDAASLYGFVRRATAAMYDGIDLARSSATDGARRRALLVQGRAGAGKTHLLCDVATRRLVEGRPTILLLGQDFSGGGLLSQAGALCQLGGTFEGTLAVLDAAGEAAGSVALLMIDALNESESPQRWRDELSVAMVAAARFPHVALVISCRSEFINEVVDEAALPTIEHVGFGEATDKAVRRFAQEFGLEAPTFPVLNPEFGNPLLLKLTCEALETLGQSRFPFGTTGLTGICETFLTAVNQRLAAPGRCDYDPQLNLVDRMVRALAQLGPGPFEREAVTRISDQVLPNRAYSKSLLRGLISEGVVGGWPDGRIAFAYQRLGDIARAALLAEQPVEALRTWLDTLGKSRWRERGVLGALAVIVPEQYGHELLDLAGGAGRIPPSDLVDGFLESLLLRSPAAVTSRTIDIVDGLLSLPSGSGEVLDRLVRIACVPGNALNAGWLHARLLGQSLSDRDRSWSTWLIGAAQAEEGNPLRPLLDWAWPTDLAEALPVADEIAELATLLFGWCLTTSDQRVRDQAAKALVAIAGRAPVGFAAGVRRFRGTNDPYVLERLAAAACGHILRISDSEQSARLANAVAELFREEWPHHLMTRDYARRVFEIAAERGWDGQTREPPYGSTWPIPTRTFEEIEALAAPPEYAYSSIWSSVSGMGDFGNYVVEPALRHVATDHRRALQDVVECAIFDRALDLGWTPERFGKADGGLSLGHREAGVERLGKKYQWIGFHEVLGRISDTHAVAGSWSKDSPKPYEYAEQLVWRDIDPSVLARKPIHNPGLTWFSPVEAHFQREIADAYPANMDPVPDPLDLIAVHDHSGVPWLVLRSIPHWRQSVPPETLALRLPHLEAWMQLHAYLIPERSVPSVRDWVKDKDWFGLWMPDTPDVANVLLGTHPDDPRWREHDEPDWWDARAGGVKPTDFSESAAYYGGTGTSRDGSAGQETTGFVPSLDLTRLLGLRRGVDFKWADEAGLAAMDPSVDHGGPASLAIRRDVVRRITESGLTLFWTALVGYDLVHHFLEPRDDDLRWVSASASYLLEEGRITRASSNAWVCKPGPTPERVLNWTSRDGE
jgi:hypothetical protein